MVMTRFTSVWPILSNISTGIYLSLLRGEERNDQCLDCAGEPIPQFCCNTGLSDLGGVAEATPMSLDCLNSLVLTPVSILKQQAVLVSWMISE